MALDHSSAVAEVFDAFGGPKKLSDAIGVPVQTVCDWQAKGSPDIPPWRRPSVLAAVNRLALDLSANARAYLASAERATRQRAAA